MTEWKDCKIEDYFELSYGKSLTAANRIAGEYPVYGSGGISGTHNESLVKGPGIIVGRKGTVGSVYWENRDFYPIDTVFYVVPKAGNDIRFLYYLLKTLPLENMNTDAAVPGLNRNNAYRLKVLDIPYDDQIIIADILGSIDQKIELNQRINETLEGMARSVFKSWFVDFDPVRAKAEGREPEGIESATAALFPSTFSPNGLPEGWEEKPISEIGDVITGKTPSTKDEENYGDQTPFITIPDMHGKIYVLACGKYLSSKGVSMQKNKTLPAGSICVSCIATPGLTILTHEECQTNQQINAVVPFKKEVQNFRFWQIKEVSEEVISKGSGGSVFHNLNKSQFSDLKVIEPSFELIKAYEEIVSSFMEKILENEKQNQTLAALRDTLLPKLISGELRVDTATEKLKEAIG